MGTGDAQYYLIAIIQILLIQRLVPQSNPAKIAPHKKLSILVDSKLSLIIKILYAILVDRRLYYFRGGNIYQGGYFSGRTGIDRAL